MNCHIFVVWPDDHGHDPVQEGIAKTGRFGYCQSQVDAGGSEVDHPRLLDHDGKGARHAAPEEPILEKIYQ